MKKTQFVLTLAFLLMTPIALMAQRLEVVENDSWCEDTSWGNSDSERYCEVRETTMDAGDQDIRIDGKQNGGVKVSGWSGNDFQIRARVIANARSESVAEDIAHSVRIQTADNRIYADGPRTRRREWYSVSYEVMVPYDSDVQIKTKNGGIVVADVTGSVRFDALNGGVVLSGLAGDVEGHTTNGGLKIELTGDEWEGMGMDVRTTNGGVQLTVPEDYSATLETSTVNGSINVDFPVTVKGKINKNLSVQLGEGGRTIEARTTNGGIKIVKG